MAEEKKSKRRIRPTESVRERAQNQPKAKPRRLKQVASGASDGLKSVSRQGRREYHVIQLPDNKVGRFMTKSRRVFPRFFSEAWHELRLVTWPTRRETIRFTSAVLVFALVFGVLIYITDYGLDKLFRNLLNFN